MLKEMLRTERYGAFSVMAYTQEESLSETCFLPAHENCSLRNASFESSRVCGQAEPLTTLTLTNPDAWTDSTRVFELCSLQGRLIVLEELP